MKSISGYFVCFLQLMEMIACPSINLRQFGVKSIFFLRRLKTNDRKIVKNHFVCVNKSNALMFLLLLSVAVRVWKKTFFPFFAYPSASLLVIDSMEMTFYFSGPTFVHRYICKSFELLLIKWNEHSNIEMNEVVEYNCTYCLCHSSRWIWHGHHNCTWDMAHNSANKSNALQQFKIHNGFPTEILLVFRME